MSTPRERLVYTAVQQLREHGVAGTGLRPLVAAAGAPWGSLRHYFPGGKQQIVAEALTWSCDFAAAVVNDYLANDRPTPQGLLRTVIRWWIEDLEHRDFARGCPVASAIGDATPTDTVVRTAANDALETWRAAIRDGLVRCGLSTKDAEELATLILAALEGAILLARAGRSTEPLRIVERRLAPLLDPCL